MGDPGADPSRKGPLSGSLLDPPSPPSPLVGFTYGDFSVPPIFPDSNEINTVVEDESGEEAGEAADQRPTPIVQEDPGALTLGDPFVRRGDLIEEEEEPEGFGSEEEVEEASVEEQEQEVDFEVGPEARRQTGPSGVDFRKRELNPGAEARSREEMRTLGRRKVLSKRRHDSKVEEAGSSVGSVTPITMQDGSIVPVTMEASTFEESV